MVLYEMALSKDFFSHFLPSDKYLNSITLKEFIFMDPNFLSLFIKKQICGFSNLLISTFSTKKLYGTLAMFPKMKRKHISLDIF